MKKLKYIIGSGVLMLLTSFLTVSCTDGNDWDVDSSHNRVFSVLSTSISLSAEATTAELKWSKITDAEYYIIEVSSDSLHNDIPMGGNNSVVFGEDKSITSTPYVLTGLEANSKYFLRIKAMSSLKEESKWSYPSEKKSFNTKSEQIFYPITDGDLEATKVTLRWPAGQVATDITLNPGDIKHTITADEITAGAATIAGLTTETKYTAIMKNGTKTRGTIEFTTLIDLGGATAINEGDSLVAILNAAVDGDSFVIMKGEFDLGEYTLTKAVSLAGYKASEKPTIRGNFKPSGTVGSLDLKNLILDGAVSGVATRSQLINADATSTVGNVNIIACEIKNYKSGLINNNTNGKFSNVKISDCIITNIVGDGGDGFDFRGGTLASLTVENSTFNSGFRAFVRVQISSNIKFNNCTFYKICNFNNSNNSGFFRCGGGTLEVSKCLFVGTGVSTYGNWSKASSNMGATPTYNNNVYYDCLNLWAGLYTNPSSCDATEKDPQFKDAANGDFTVQNSSVSAGDPRWLK